MNFNREVNVLEMAQPHIDDFKREIADLQLCLKETNILLVASIKREKEGVDIMQRA